MVYWPRHYHLVEMTDTSHCLFAVVTPAGLMNAGQGTPGEGHLLCLPAERPPPGVADCCHAGERAAGTAVYPLVVRGRDSQSEMP